MKTLKLLFITASIFCIQLSIAQETTNSIKVTITNIESNEGTIQVGLYSQEERFLKKTYKSIATKAIKGSVEVVFKNIPNNTYAISLYHDEDGNKELNKLFGMIPTEPYGISNNAKETYSAPSWEKAKFKLENQNLTQFISL